MHVEKVGKKAAGISLAAVLAFAFVAQGQPHQRTGVSGQMPAVVPSLQPLGRLDGSARLRLSIDMPLHHLAALTNLLEQIYDPANPLYHHYLAPEEFDARFGPTEEEYQTVTAWATRSGFAITTRHPNRMLLEVSASVADIERALQVTMRTYQHPTEARTFFAPDTEPSLDSSLPILNISGLDNFARPHPANLRRTPLKTPAQATPHTVGSGPNGNLAGFDYRAAYAPGVSLTGTGQTVGLLEFDAYYPGDITSYESQTGVSNVPLQVVLLDGATTNAGTENGEVALDIEMAISMAPGLSSVVVFEAGPDGVPNDVLEAMASTPTIKQFSCSWAFGGLTTSERTAMDGYFMKMATQGQSFFASSGDVGAAASGVPISAPDDDPYVTVVGGTVLGTAGPGSAWLSETVWNAQEGPGFNESSGGVSTVASYVLPPWQKGVNMTANKGSTAKRNVPDVAMVADNIFIVADGGTNETTGGTSAATPLWAGFAALVNQQAVAAGLPTLGFANPALYHIGTNSGYTACFDDVIVGNNTNTTSPIHYLAVPGYDLCTGWGSPSGGSLIVALTQPDGFQITPGRGAVANGPIGGPFTVSAQTISLTNTGATALNWALGSAPPWLNVSSSSGSLAASGGGASIFLNLNTTADLLAGGLYVADLWFTNLSSGQAQLRQFTLQVEQELVQDGGFEAGDFCYWNLAGNSSIYTNNFVDYTGDPFGPGYDYSAYAGEWFAALGQVSSLAYLSQRVPTQAGQLYLLSLWFENPTGYTPNQFLVQWNTNSTSQNTIYNQSSLGAFGWSNLLFLVSASSNTTLLQFGARNDNDFIVLDNVSVMPVPQPVFQPLAVVNGSLQLTWTALPGVTYLVQSTSDLAQANWNTIGSVTAAANPATFSVNIGTDPQLFYRVIIMLQ